MTRLRRAQAAAVGMAAAIVAASGNGFVYGLDTALAEDLTETAAPYSCIVERVVVDPDARIFAVDPGCTIELEAQAFGPGGLFDVCAEDDWGGYGGECGFDPIAVSDGDRFTFDYTAGDALPAEVTVEVYLQPHSPDYVCTGEIRGAVGRKTFERGDVGRDCLLTLRVAEEIDLGEIRFTVDYGQSGVEVPGCGRGVACSSPVGDWSVPFGGSWDSDDTRELHFRVASGQGFSSPSDVYRCELRKIAGAADPLPDDFIVSVTAARSPPPLSKTLTDLPAVTASVDCALGPTTTTTLDFEPAACGRPCSPGSPLPKARDALYVLAAAVGTDGCKTCICDVNRSGRVDATDSLTVLFAAVGLDVWIRCVLCAEPVPPACD